jgi:hypothetical protein
MTAPSNEVEALRDALDHIKRVASQGVTPTRRLDWIAYRASVALRGESWEPGMRKEPDNSVLKLQKENKRLRDSNNESALLLEEAARRIKELEGGGE